MGESANSPNTPSVSHHTLVSLIGPRTQTLVGACVLAMTGYTLGLEWLASRFVGIPAGLWLVGLAVLIVEYRRQARAAAGAEQVGVTSRFDPIRLRLPRVSLDHLRAAMPGSAAVGGMLELVGVNADRLDSAKRTITDLTSKVAPSTNTLRIGVDLNETDARELIAYGLREDNLGVEVEWMKARSGLVTDIEQDMAAGGFDVIVRRESRGDINIFVSEQEGRVAAWQDWSQPLPFGYSGVFPPRIDPARVALVDCDLQDRDHAALAAQMTLACAMLARVPGRAAPAARSGLGRVLVARPAIAEIARPGGPVSMIVGRMSASVGRFGKAGSGVVPAFAKAAARACISNLVSFEHGAAAGSCVETIKSANALIGVESEAVLRLAAAEFAAGRVSDARQTMLRACDSLMSEGVRCESDPLAFIMSEVEMGEPGQMTLGRIAAGIALAWATSPPDSVDYLREDLLDDLAHAGWLRDRPGDVQLLKGVIEALEAHTKPRLQAAA